MRKFYQKHMEQRGAIMWSQQNQIREGTQPSEQKTGLFC